MATRTKTLVNNGAKSASVVYKGRQIVLGPHQEQDFDEEIADDFLSKWSPIVALADDIGGVFEDGVDTSSIWVANVTGHPDAPETLPGKTVKDKQWVVCEQPNPRKDARTLIMKAKGPMVEFIGKDGHLAAKNTLGKKYEIPAFRRRQFPSAIARWWLNREGASCAQGPHGETFPCVIRSRAPSNFEPDSSWELNDIRLYTRLCDADAELGPSQEDLEKYGEDVVAAKKLALKRLYFHLVDPQCVLPTQREFMAVKQDEFLEAEKVEKMEKKAFTAEEVAVLEAVERLKGKAGRRSKHQLELLEKAEELRARLEE